MQEIWSLRRKSTSREIFKTLLLLSCFYFYTCLSDIYLFLPPMIGLLFVFFVQTSRENRWITTFGIVICLLFYELDHAERVGILPLLFVITNWLVIKKFRWLFEENVFFVFAYIPLIYLVYIFTLYIFGIFKGMLGLDLDLVFLSYIFYESCLGIVYEKIKYQI